MIKLSVTSSNPIWGRGNSLYLNQHWLFPGEINSLSLSHNNINSTVTTMTIGLALLADNNFIKSHIVILGAITIKETCNSFFS